jgi:hypothetical protein
MDSRFKEYKKSATQLMRPYEEGESLEGVSVTEGVTPAVGGMIAIDRDDPTDQWYVAEDFFAANYEAA